MQQHFRKNPESTAGGPRQSIPLSLFVTSVLISTIWATHDTVRRFALKKRRRRAWDCFSSPLPPPHLKFASSLGYNSFQSFSHAQDDCRGWGVGGRGYRWRDGLIIEGILSISAFVGPLCLKALHTNAHMEKLPDNKYRPVVVFEFDHMKVAFSFFRFLFTAPSTTFFSP